jgi:hypothetical protein
MMSASTIRVFIATVIASVGIFVADASAAEPVEYTDADVGYRLELPPNWTKVKVENVTSSLKRRLEQRGSAIGVGSLPIDPRLAAAFMRVDESGISANAFILTFEFENGQKDAMANPDRSDFFAGVVETATSRSSKERLGDVQGLVQSMDGSAALVDDQTMQVVLPNPTKDVEGHGFIWMRVTDARAVALVAKFRADDWSDSKRFRELLADTYHVDGQLPRSDSTSLSEAEEIGELVSQICCLGIGALMAAWLLWASGLLDKRNFRHLEDNEDD